MLDRLIDLIYKAVERLWALPDDLFDIEDEENAIIDE